MAAASAHAAGAAEAKGDVEVGVIEGNCVPEGVAVGGSGSADAKRATVEARLRAREAARGEVRAARQARELEAKDPVENAHKFWSEFQSSRSQLADEVEAFSAKDKARIGAAAEGWTARVGELQRRVADATLFLPAYDVRQAQAAIATLKEQIAAVKEKFQPRKRFTFKSRGKRAAAAAAAAEAAPAAAEAKSAKSAGGDDSCAKYDVDEKSFEGRTGEVLVLRTGELGAEGGDFKLARLVDCTVVLKETVHALRIDHLERCHVYAGAVSGSVLLDACTDCVFDLASRQIRIHTSKRCDYYLHVLSRPIIEHSEALRFAPSGLRYEGLGEQRRRAGLEAERAATLWAAVDDFGWHRVQKSPNWSIIAVEARLSSARAGDVEIVPSTKQHASVAGAGAGGTAGVDAAAAGAASAAPAATGEEEDSDDDDEL